MEPRKSAAGEPRLWSPYLAGFAIGLTLILTYYVMGHGLVASGAYTQVAAGMLYAEAPRHAQANAYLKGYLQPGALFHSWIVIEVFGVLLGGLFGAWTHKRFRLEIERGPKIGEGDRLLFALLGGIFTGFGSRLAQGCTTAQSLSGGSVLSVGSWLFTLAFFLAGYLVASLVKREWQ